jgi:hypothetical protein
MMKLEYVVVVSSEHAAGIRGFTDEITIQIKDGSPDAETVLAATEHFRQALKDWYDGGAVYTKEQYNEIFYQSDNDRPDEGDLLPSDEWEKQS